MLKYLTAVFMLAATVVSAGEVRPLIGNEPGALPIRIVCETEADVLEFLNTFDQDVLSRVACLVAPMAIPLEVTPEYRYLDDQGDLTVIYSVNGEPYWTYFFAHHFDVDT